MLTSKDLDSIEDLLGVKVRKLKKKKIIKNLFKLNLFKLLIIQLKANENKA